MDPIDELRLYLYSSQLGFTTYVISDATATFDKSSYDDPQKVTWLFSRKLSSKPNVW